MTALNLRLVLVSAVAAIAAATTPVVAEEKWPTKPIKFIVAYPAGSMGDMVMRIIQPQLQAKLGVPVVVDNKAGAGGNIGAASVATAPADGYTVLVAASNNFTANQYLYKNLGYKANALTPVSQLVDVPSVVYTNTLKSVSSFKEFSAQAQAAGGTYNYGSPGAGTAPQLIAETINQQARLGLTHIPYKGSPATVTALMSGEIQMIVAGLGVGLPHVKSGRFKALAYGGKNRSSEIPDVPTLAELGLPELRASTWWGLAVPTNTPKDCVAKLSAALQGVIVAPEVRSKLHDVGADPIGSTPEQMAVVVQQDKDYWKTVIEKAGIKLD